MVDAVRAYCFVQRAAFSPDGHWLAFNAAIFAPALQSRVWIVPVAGGSPRAVTPGIDVGYRRQLGADGGSLRAYG